MGAVVGFWVCGFHVPFAGSWLVAPAKRHPRFSGLHLKFLDLELFGKTVLVANKEFGLSGPVETSGSEALYYYIYIYRYDIYIYM